MAKIVPVSPGQLNSDSIAGLSIFEALDTAPDLTKIKEAIKKGSREGITVPIANCIPSDADFIHTLGMITAAIIMNRDPATSSKLLLASLS
ncbi:MAG: hypothetical protein ACYCX2_07250 [Christensenellales bacterium]